MLQRVKNPIITLGEFVFTIIMLLFTTICYLLKNNVPMILNWFGVIIFLYAVYTWKKKTNSPWFSPYTIFWLFFVIFNYGQPIMWAFGIHLQEEIGKGVLYSGSNYSPSAEDLVNAQWYICLGMLFFHIGACFFAKRGNADCKLRGDIEIPCVKKIEQTKAAMLKVGIILTMIISPIAFYSKIREVFIARNYGYKELYYGQYSTQGGYLQILQYLFFPALICCLVGSGYTRKMRIIIYSIFGVYAILGVLSGDRGGWLYSLIILLWLHTYYVKISKKKFLLYGLLFIVGIYLLSVITNVRDSGLDSLTFTDFIEVFSSEQSPVIDAFFEMGGNMGIIVFFLHTGNSVYPYGNSYITALLGAVLSKGLSLFNLDMILLGNWFSQDYLGISWGTGFSMIGEAYLNGGYWEGLVYMFILGVLIGKLIQFASKSRNNESPIKLFVSAAGLNVVIGFARSDCYLVLKELLYGVGFVVLAVFIVLKIIGAKTPKEEMR